MFRKIVNEDANTFCSTENERTIKCKRTDFGVIGLANGQLPNLNMADHDLK